MSMDSWNWWRHLIRDLHSGAVKQFVRLPAQARRRYLTISASLVVAELSLRLWPLQTILGALSRRCARAQRRCSAMRPTQEECQQLARLVELADAHGLLRPSCLRRSLTLAWLLSTRGVPVEVTIGVTKDQEHLHAHACLDVLGRSPLRLLGDPTFVDLRRRHEAAPAIANGTRGA